MGYFARSPGRNSWLKLLQKTREKLYDKAQRNILEEITEKNTGRNFSLKGVPSETLGKILQQYLRWREALVEISAFIVEETYDNFFEQNEGGTPE